MIENEIKLDRPILLTRCSTVLSCLFYIVNSIYPKDPKEPFNRQHCKRLSHSTEREMFQEWKVFANQNS